MKPAIRVEALSKQYRIGTATRGVTRNLTESIADSVSAMWGSLTGRARGTVGASEFWALKDISFQAHPGEVVGIIGHNGAGKSTLLKILSRIVSPTSGSAELRGRVGSLLEVGTGFHPELSGRENIYLNGAVLGMTKSEITKRFDAIVDFADVCDFLDVPVKRYSTGMGVRLAFAVAAHVNPDIIIIDEVLAVGDAAFQSKCLRHLETLQESGATILLVSHQLATLKRVCPRLIILNHGQMLYDGPTSNGIVRYYQAAFPKTSEATPVPPAPSGSPVRILRASCVGAAGPLAPIQYGESMTFELTYEAMEPVDSPTFHFSLQSPDQLVYTGWHTAYDGFQVGMVRTGVHKLRLNVPYIGLEPGIYTGSLGIWSANGFAAYHWVWHHLTVTIAGDRRLLGRFEYAFNWSHD